MTATYMPARNLNGPQYHDPPISAALAGAQPLTSAQMQHIHSSGQPAEVKMSSGNAGAAGGGGIYGLGIFGAFVYYFQ